MNRSDRRAFLSTTALAAFATEVSTRTSLAQDAGKTGGRGPYRVAVIGSTGRGDYGHGLDSAFQDVERAEIVAVADPHDSGRQRAASRLRVTNAYADFRQMLNVERPDIVCVCPGWVNERVEMVTA